MTVIARTGYGFGSLAGSTFWLTWQTFSGS